MTRHRAPGRRGVHGTAHGSETGKLTAQLPALVPQAHGGALYHGGVPGHVGAGGRPPSALRARLRGSFDERVKVLEEIADDQEAPRTDRIRAVDVLAKYGLGAASDVTVDQVRDRLAQTVELVRATLPKQQAEAVIERMRGIWTT